MIAALDILALALAFAAGVFIGDAFGFWRHRVLINRAIKAGRMNLTVPRAYFRALKAGRRWL